MNITDKKKINKNCALPLSEALKLYGKGIKSVLSEKVNSIKKRKQ